MRSDGNKRIMNDNELIRKRLMDADRASYGQNVLKTVGFLSLEEQGIYHSLAREFMSDMHFLSGGEEDNDRAVAFFVPDYLDREQAIDETLRAILTEPVNHRFADELTHRDYLGAMMNLGIERECIGDIRILKGEHAGALIYARADMADYIARNLTRVKHTSMDSRCMSLEELGTSGIAGTQEYEELAVNVASERVDAVIAAVYHVARQKAADVINAERVYINGQITNSAGKTLKAGDRVSVRGTGKFIYDGISGTSRKGRLFAAIRKYV